MVGAEDENALRAAALAHHDRLIAATLIGDECDIRSAEKRHSLCLTGMDLRHAEDDPTALRLALQLYDAGKIDVLMKGQISTKEFLRSLLDKAHGLASGRILSHVAAFELNG
ncbi:MAG: phosphate acetyl/acyltransferase, partial [Planctomycetota bacterium]